MTFMIGSDYCDKVLYRREDANVMGEYCEGEEVLRSCSGYWCWRFELLTGERHLVGGIVGGVVVVAKREGEKIEKSQAIRKAT